MNEILYNQYGRNMINDFHNVSGLDVKLCVIFEGPVPYHAFRNEKIDIIQMANPEHDKFTKYFGHLHQARGLTIKLSKDNKKADLVWNYRFDAIRFSFKIFSIIQAINLITTDEPFAWIDADIRCLQKFNSEDMKPFLPEGSELMSYLGRDNHPYSECGFLGFNAQHPKCLEFLTRMKNIYTSGEIFSLTEWHDSWIWDYVRNEYESQGINFKNISGAARTLEHPFINCGLGKYFDHLKGAQRKADGHSSESDYKLKK
jgi:hypothetical protein